MMRRAPAPAFTLLEVLISLFIVGTAVGLLTEGYTLSLRAINANRVDTMLAFLAQGKMAEVTARIISPDLDNDGTFEAEGFPEYAWHIETAATETAGLSVVSVTVREERPEGHPREFTLQRLVYAPEAILGSIGGMP